MTPVKITHIACAIICIVGSAASLWADVDDPRKIPLAICAAIYLIASHAVKRLER